MYIKIANVLNILLIGSNGVGKTAFINRLSNIDFEPNYFPTQVQSTTTVNYNHETFNLVEIATASGYSKIQYLEAVAIILMFDYTNNLSYEYLQYWYNNTCPVKHIPIVIVANKIDIPYIEHNNPKKPMPFERQNLRYFEISVKNNTNVTNVIDYLYEEMLKTRK